MASRKTTVRLLAVPNVSEGREEASVAAIGEAFTGRGAARLLDVHSDGDHHRAVFTVAGVAGTLAEALAEGVGEALRRVDVGPGRAAAQVGRHPHVGAVDVVPVVYLDLALRGAACAEALVAAELIGGLGVPVVLYGELGGGRTRAELRRGGLAGLARRLGAGELDADFGPAAPHATGGVTLLAARPPLVAFNVELAAPAGMAQARRIAALIREGGAEGLPGVRAMAVELRAPGASLAPGGAGAGGARVGGARTGTGRPGEAPEVVAQVSTNVERPGEVRLAEVVAAVARHAPVACAELVGLAPAAALEGFPAEVRLRGFRPERQVLERALAGLAGPP